MLSVSKIVPAHRKTINFNWVRRDFQKFGFFKESRLRMKCGVEGWQTCFWCKHKFTDDEVFGIGQLEKGPNKPLCSACIDILEKNDSA